ncbi:MAG: hypothetical protein M0Q38_02720 [Bacteroidales bacterium]|jgi:hypothetical protein|nr:hypothetical protein [Bacteroidales bacterium]
MELKITTIIPTDDKELADRLMNSLIYDQAVVLGIVVGNDNWCIDLIQKADRVAYARKSIRRAVWIRNPKLVDKILSSLFSHSEGLIIPETLPYFFTVTMADKACDIILPGEINPDNVSIDKSFRKAEIG